MISPRVVSADSTDTGAGRLQRTSEVGHGKGRHFILYAEFNSRGVESIDGLTHLRQQACLPTNLRRMCIKASDLRKEDLALHVYSCRCVGAGLDQQCYLF